MKNIKTYIIENNQDVYDFSMDKFKKLAKENGDGIYLIYKDHLSSDAWQMFVVKDNEILDEQEGWLWSSINYYSKNREPVGTKVQLSKLQEKYKDLTLYIANLGYYTFKGQWKYTDVKNDKTYKSLDFKEFDVASKSSKK